MIEEKSTQRTVVHNLILEGRKNLSVSGVTDVVSFDENTVVLGTGCGELTIRGCQLHISKTNVETGELVMDGEISEMSYSDESSSSGGGIFSRIFKQG